MPRQIDQYSLHVLPTGEELRFAQLPRWEDTRACSIYLRDSFGNPVPIHQVRVLKFNNGRVVEEIEVRSIKVNCGQAFICPRPHGAGWAVHNDDSDNFTLYRRPAPKAGQRIFSTVDDWQRAVAEGGE